MSYQNKKQQIKEILNDNLGKEKAESILLSIESELGGKTEETLALIQESDLSQLGVPVLLARQVSKIAAMDNLEPNRIFVMDDDPVKRAARMKIAELVAEFDPDDPTNAYAARLAALTSGKPCMAYNDSGVLNRTVSARVAQEIVQGYPERKTIRYAGETLQLSPVLQPPTKSGIENPVIVGDVLYPDGTSRFGICWMKIPEDIRQLIFIAFRPADKGGSGEFATVTTAYNEKNFFEKIVQKSFEEVAEIFPNAALKYMELKKLNNLPSMSVALKTLANAGK